MKERKATRCSLNICKIQWNIIMIERKKERKTTRCSLNICKLELNIIKNERKKKERKKVN